MVSSSLSHLYHGLWTDYVDTGACTVAAQADYSPLKVVSLTHGRNMPMVFCFALKTNIESITL